MEIVINGVARMVQSGVSIGQLLGELELAPIRVAVELNEDLVPRKSFDQTRLKPGDRLEIVTLVGGG